MLTDERVIAEILTGSVDEDKAIDYIYRREFFKVRSFLMKMGARDHEVEDVFQDTLIVFYEKVKNGTYRPNASISTYLHAVARNIWLTQAEKKKRVRVSDPNDFISHEDTKHILDVIESREVGALLRSLFDRLNKDCQAVLSMSIYDQLSMDVIAQKMKFQSAQIARNKKYKCLKNLKTSF